MAAILFSDFDALRLVLARGAVPATIANAPVRWGTDSKNRLWIEPSVALPRTVASALTRFGALVQGTSGAASTETAASWPCVLPLDSTMPDPSDAALFDLPHAETVPHFVSELRRLGAGKIGFRSAGCSGAEPAVNQRCFLLVERPPLATLLGTVDRTPGSPRAYRQQAPRVWVELGHRHPLAHLIAPPAGHVAMLAAPRIYRWLLDAPFQHGPDLFTLPRSAADSADRPLSECLLPVDVRLHRSDDGDSPEFWIVPETRLQELHMLVAQWDDRLVAKFKHGVRGMRGATSGGLQHSPRA